MNTVFKTTRLPFAAYLHCQQLLPFRGCEAVDKDTACFSFDDPDHKAEELELQFDQGRGDMVAARNFVAAERFLKRKLQQVLEEVND
jgi:hypothetical protein